MAWTMGSQEVYDSWAGICWGQDVWWGSETEQDSMVLAMSSACLLPVENFSQKISLIREVKNGETKENSLRRLSSVQFSSVAQSCPTLCDPMNRSMPGLPVHHQLPESTQIHVH